MKITKKEQKLLLYVLGVAIMLIVYLYVFTNIQDKNAVLERERTQLQQTVSKMETWDANKDNYKKQTASMEKELTDLYKAYPADIKEENIIMYTRELEKNTGLEANSVNIAGQNLLATIGKAQRTKYLYGSNLQLEFTGSYDGIKNAVEQIQKDPNKKNVESLSLSFDSSTAKLLGTMNVNCFSMAGTSQSYDKPVIPTMPIGSNNIFGN